MSEEKKNKNENKQLSLSEVYNSGESVQNRSNVHKEIQGPPRINYSHAFKKTDAERSEHWNMVAAFRELLKLKGISKRKVPYTVYSRM